MASPAVHPKTKGSFDTFLSDIPAENIDSNDSNASVDTVFLGEFKAVDAGSLLLQGHMKNAAFVSNDDKTMSGNSFIREEANVNQCDEKGPAKVVSTFASSTNDVQMVASDGVCFFPLL